MKREYYSNTISGFLDATPDEISFQLMNNNEFSLLKEQRDAWAMQIIILKSILKPYQGAIYFEYSIPRMGRRIDAVVIIQHVIFVLEFKIGETDFLNSAIDQVWDYALDLKNFHETSHNHFIAPVLIATHAPEFPLSIKSTPHDDKLLFPIKTNETMLSSVIEHVLSFTDGSAINYEVWGKGRYCPTPTIVEAAMALYRGHAVEDISRHDAGAINLSQTSETISEIVKHSKQNHHKSICFVTGVPGAGKTLVGLNIATAHIDKKSELYSVFLSGNGPLVAILREALARDRVRQFKEKGTKKRKIEVVSEVKEFIQNVHHFRDDCLIEAAAPVEHIVLFDEAQRAWNKEQTSSFMRRKKKVQHFNQSEPEFLISCLDRHLDWAVIVCLVGGGQEINTGEAGIGEWIESLMRSFPHWHMYLSPRLADSEYDTNDVLEKIKNHPNLCYEENLHLSVSMRSFRAEKVSLLVKQLLDCQPDKCRQTHNELKSKYPIVITRDLNKAKHWLKQQARGSERYGIVVSSQAERLKPHAIDVKSPMDPIHWFLDQKEDVRSSYYLEDVATEFHIQGLELDWACITWDADFRFSKQGWGHWSFCGSKWNRIKKAERQLYQKNAYRVLLTRARQGMVIFVPSGDQEDITRQSCFYDPTFNYLKEIGFSEI